MRSLATGAFTCDIGLRRVRAPEFVREEREGVTYFVARGYEIAYETTLYFGNGAQLPVRARLVGELNQRVVIRDEDKRPVRLVGFVQGLTEIHDSDGRIMFRGRYYDSRTAQALAGDDAFTAIGRGVVDHWESAFGEGAYAGHAFSLGVQLVRDGDGPLHGTGRGEID